MGSVDQSGQDSSESPVSFDTLTGAAYAEATLVYNDPEAALSAQASNDSAISFISHTLDIAGILPGIGAVANGANAIIQLSQGHTVQAAFYATGALASVVGIPGGSAVAKVGEAVIVANDIREVAEEGSIIVGATESLAGRVDAIHGVLDPIAASNRTTAVLETAGGTRIVGSGGRDLSPAQRAALLPGEVAAKLPGAHAEVTVLEHAAASGLTPSELSVSRTICPNCAARITQSGGRVTSPTTAKW